MHSVTLVKICFLFVFSIDDYGVSREDSGAIDANTVHAAARADNQATGLLDALLDVMLIFWRGQREHAVPAAGPG